MEVTAAYIISQILTLILYGFLGISYLQKNRNKVLIFNIIVDILHIIAMCLLKGYSGAAMGLVSLYRDIFLLIYARKKNSKKIDIFILITSIVLIITLSLITYDGIFSMLSILATLITTFAIWQKNVKYYKLLGIISSLLWMLYNVFIFSVVGIVLESIVFIFSTIGYIKEIKSIKTGKE